MKSLLTNNAVSALAASVVAINTGDPNAKIQFQQQAQTATTLLKSGYGTSNFGPLLNAFEQKATDIGLTESPELKDLKTAHQKASGSTGNGHDTTGTKGTTQPHAAADALTGKGAEAAGAAQQ